MRHSKLILLLLILLLILLILPTLDWYKYERDGYTVVQDIYSKKHVEKMNKVLDGYVEQ